MSKSHEERLKAWRQKRLIDQISVSKFDIDRIVSVIDCNMYGFSIAKPKTEQRTRLSGRVRRIGGE